MSLGSFSANTLAQETDTLCFTLEQAKQLLRDAEAGLVCDSLLENRALKIIGLYDIIGAKDDQIVLSGEVIQKQSNKLKKSDKKINRLRVLGFGLGFVVLLEALIISLLVF